ncbi:MAG: hypothetical protein EOO89_23515 [Pedobacter sp.]|nr:MAG: hypothetical protein EOO89_23515 [Pedobacter sp.]
MQKLRELNHNNVQPEQSLQDLPELKADLPTLRQQGLRAVEARAAAVVAVVPQGLQEPAEAKINGPAV